MGLFAGLKNIVRTNEPLAGRTWMRIGGPAKYFIQPEDVEQLGDVVSRCRENEVPMYVLGSGANLLIDDAGVKGAVISLQQGEFMRTEFNETGVCAWAGADMGKLEVMPLPIHTRSGSTP